MISVSDSWKEIHTRTILPESFLEISVGITDVDVRDLVEVSSENEAVFSNAENAVTAANTPTPANYATLEQNLWVLDGTRNILPDNGPYATPGYVSADDSEAVLILSLPEPRAVVIPGFTITWSSEYGEYATSFTVEVKNGDTVVGTATVADNTSKVSTVEMEVSNYDSVVITITGWSMPNRRRRIDRIMFGHVIAFGKSDILGYSHEQHGSLNSAELPKHSIEFSLNNLDDKWNPSNPTGLERFLSERQEVSVRYGFDVNGVPEWIKAGRFYLSEWRTPSNGLEANFVARDAFEYMLNEPYTGITTGTLAQIVASAISTTSLPSDFQVNVDPSLENYTATVPEGKTVAAVIQMCANAAGCVMWQDRDGVLNIRPLDRTLSDYTIASAFSYSHPEVELSKPLKAVSVDYGTNVKYVLPVGDVGETQTVSNPLIGTEAQATTIATWVRDTLEPRKTVTGDFRADPRLDLFDMVSVESKYGAISPVAITNIKYAYSGAFRASYTGKVAIAVKNGVVDGYWYVDNVITGVNGLVEFEGAYYYVNESGKIFKSATKYVSAQLGLTKGRYLFGEDGKMIRTPGLVKVGDDFYYIASVGTAYIGTKWVSADNGYGLSAGNYEFGSDGKMIGRV